MNIIEEMARAMGASKAWPVVFESGSARILATAAMNVLRRRGYLSELGIAAAKQAEAERTDR